MHGYDLHVLVLCVWVTSLSPRVNIGLLSSLVSSLRDYLHSGFIKLSPIEIQLNGNYHLQLKTDSDKFLAKSFLGVSGILATSILRWQSLKKMISWFLEAKGGAESTKPLYWSLLLWHDIDIELYMLVVSFCFHFCSVPLKLLVEIHSSRFGGIDCSFSLV